jgi:hypothetical protein
MVRSQLTFRIRDEGHLLGFYFEYEIYELILGAIPFNVEFRNNDLADLPHIIVTDVSFIGTRMNRYAIGPKALHIYGRLHNVGVVAATGIPERGYLIDIDRKLCQ